MLDCQAVHQFLHPYLDGELNARDAVDIQAHLDKCPDCTALYRNEKLFLDLLKKSIPRAYAPVGLDLKVKQALDGTGERKRSTAWFRFVIAPSLAAALVAVVVMAVVFVEKKSVPDLVDIAVNTHQAYSARNVKLDIQSHDPTLVSQWVQKQTGFAVSLAQEPVKHLQLLGGRLVEIQDKKAVFLAYEVGGRPLSLVMTAAQGVEPFGGQEMVEKQVRFYQSSYHGFQTLSWTLEGMAYVFVSDAQELNRQACQICHNAGRQLQSPTGRHAKPM